jgi:heme a synthase
MSNASNRSVHRFAVFTASCTVILLTAGALVTSNDAADSVPDWPLAYGKIIPPLVGGIRYEFTHRVVAALVAILTTALAIWLARVEKRPLVRRLGWTAFGLIIVQALLGATRVLFGHAAIVATIHAAIAQLFFITTVSLAVLTSPWSVEQRAPVEDSGSPRVTTLALATTLIVFAQLILGAGFRHGAFGILPHLIGAVAVAVSVIWTGRAAKKRFANIPEIRRAVVWLHASFGTQFLLGFAAYWAVAKAINESQPSLPYVIFTVAHVIVGALVLAASVVLAIISARTLRPSRALEVSSSAQRATV